MEIELKYAARPETLEALLADPDVVRRMTEPVRVIEMRTTYYDTPSRSLRARHWTLRLRRENDRCVATCKDAGERDGALSSHGEWECCAEDVADAIPQLVALGAPAELQSLCASGVEATCTAAFTRRAVILRLPGDAQAELCCDTGVLRGSVEEEPLCEAELELVQGEVAALQRYADRLAERFGLIPEPRSKLSRALALK